MGERRRRRSSHDSLVGEGRSHRKGRESPRFSRSNSNDSLMGRSIASARQPGRKTPGGRWLGELGQKSNPKQQQFTLLESSDSLHSETLTEKPEQPQPNAGFRRRYEPQPQPLSQYAALPSEESLDLFFNTHMQVKSHRDSLEKVRSASWVGTDSIFTPSSSRRSSYGTSSTHSRRVNSTHSRKTNSCHARTGEFMPPITQKEKKSRNVNSTTITNPLESRETAQPLLSATRTSFTRKRSKSHAVFAQLEIPSFGPGLVEQDQSLDVTYVSAPYAVTDDCAQSSEPPPGMFDFTEETTQPGRNASPSVKSLSDFDSFYPRSRVVNSAA